MTYVCTFFFNDTATTEIYTLSLHDALPICSAALSGRNIRHHPTPQRADAAAAATAEARPSAGQTARHQPPERQAPRKPSADRKSTRLNFSHANISYAVFCLKKK